MPRPLHPLLLPILVALVAPLACACDDEGGAEPGDTGDLATSTTGDGTSDAASTTRPDGTSPADATTTDATPTDGDTAVLPSCDAPGPAQIMRTAFGTAYAIDGCGQLFTWGPRHPFYDPAVDRSIRPTPTQIGTARWREIVATDRHLCGIQLDGSLWCWGQNTGALGFEAAELTYPEPVRVGVESDWQMLSAKFSGLMPTTVCGLRNEGELHCWGGNVGGFLTLLDDDLPEFLRTPSRVGDRRWEHIEMEFGAFCGVTTEGELWCAGNDNVGQLGQGTTDANGWQPLVQVPGEWRWVGVHQAGTCALATDGALWCWGGLEWLDSFGEGDGPHPSPLRIGEAETFATVSFGTWHLAGVTAAGHLAELTRAWGGELTVEASGRDDWVDVSVVDGSREQPWGGVCLGSANGEIWCRGNNARAELGQGTWATRWTPTQVGGDAEWLDVAIHGFGVCASKADDVYCWGSPSVFVPNAPIEHVAPTPTNAPARMVRLAFDAIGEVCGLSETGELYCLGTVNGFGVLGVDIANFEPGVWHQVGDQAGWTDIALPVHDACGIRAGALYCWGSFGGGSVDTPHDPVNTDWVDIALPPVYVNQLVGCGLRAGGTAWCVAWDGTATRIGTASELSAATMRSIDGEPSICATTSTDTEVCAPADGTADFAEVPGPVYLAVARVGDRTCGVHADSTLRCDATEGPLVGTGDPVGSASNALSEPGWFDVGFNGNTVCGLRGTAPNGELWCWGEGVGGFTGVGEAHYDLLLRVPGIGR